MEEYIHTMNLKSSDTIKAGDIERLSALLGHDKGIENFRISPDEVFLEYNTYLYTQNQVEQMLFKNGLKRKENRKLGFVSRQMMNLAESNRKTFGNRKPDCCQLNE